MQNSIISSIALNGLELPVHLGWPENERSQKQTVILDLKLQFPEPPVACITDNLEDTFCYDTLIKVLREKISTKKFRLLENLGREIYLILQEALKTEIYIAVRITKKPGISNLTGGVSFSYGDNIW